jgi:hypothetical protein
VGSNIWNLRLVSDSSQVSALIQGQVQGAAAENFAALVALSGGTERDMYVIRYTTITAEKDDDLPFSIPRGVAAYALMGLGLISFFFLCLPQVADRREGVLETLRVLPTSPTALLLARVLALLVLQIVCAVLIAGNIGLLMAAIVEEVTLPSGWMVVAGVGGLALIDASYLCVGVLAPTAKLANSSASGPMTLQALLLIAGMWKQLPFWNDEAPPWLPLGGVLVVDGPFSCLISLVASAGAAVLLVSICGHLLATRVSLVLRRGDE